MKKKRKLNHKQIIFLCLVTACVAVAAGWLAAGQLRKNQTAIQSGGNIQQTEDKGVVTYQGRKYTYNRNLKNILFLGVDKREEVQVQTFAGKGGQSDAIQLFVMDRKEKTTKVLQISRDSMINLKIYDAEGDLLAEERGQIALQYAYGDGEKKSCRLSADAVSELLYGVPVDGYISLNMDGIVSIVDTIGGVPITFAEDYSYVEPEYTAGTSTVLDGAAAERFVRYRDIAITGSNNIRMERQNIFLNALVQSIRSYLGSGEGYDTLLDSASPYMVTDISAEEMKALSEYVVEDPVYKVPGETVEGEEHDEYLVDDDALYEMILKIFYTEAEE